GNNPGGNNPGGNNPGGNNPGNNPGGNDTDNSDSNNNDSDATSNIGGADLSNTNDEKQSEEEEEVEVQEKAVVADGYIFTPIAGTGLVEITRPGDLLSFIVKTPLDSEGDPVQITPQLFPELLTGDNGIVYEINFNERVSWSINQKDLLD
ncbi:hypothetical protein ACSYAD_18585, partial [Acaryochloris marina NIES-2412]|uniref:hypothetical protein n=1 Tax=Acaryochloris marina TaxID=155978 RepID=UPI004058ECB6